MKSTITKKISTHVNRYILIFTLLLALTDCDSFVEVDLPQSQLTRTGVFESTATANAALTDIYSKMRDQGVLSGTVLGLSNQLGSYADELNSYTLPGDQAIPFFTNALLPSNITVASYWNTSYNYIYSCNSVMEGVEKSSELSTADKKLLRGEALFIRAIMHFYLVNLYGDIPYITTTDYKGNNTARKSSIEAVYKLIIIDLEESITLLNPAYKNTERTRPNKYTAQSLLSRVYLYNKNWAEASNSASAVLNAAALYQLGDQLSGVFLKKSKETIWQFQPLRAGKNTDEASSFIFFTAPPPLSSLTPQLAASFETGDLRRSSWIKTVSGQGQVFYHAFKYKQNINTAESLEYSIVLRLAEQYLIRSEARAEQGDLIGAKEDLNKIRNRAGLNDTNAESQVEILKAVLLERKREFFTEYGHRFFDLKRSGELNNILSASKTGWDDSDSLFPLPQNELSINPNLLPQNYGY